MDIYIRLQKLLDKHPSGARASVSFNKILRILFTSEEAEIACHLTFKLQPLEEIIPKISMGTVELKAALDKMAERGSIVGIRIENKDYYALLPILPGFYEFPFMRKERSPDSQELAGFWKQYFYEGLSDAFIGSPTPQMRVIPVEKTISNFTEVLHYEKVINLIDRAELIAVTNCACKEIMNNCSKPREVCMAFDNSARYLLDKGWAREISKQETIEIIEETEEEGMVHCVRNSRDKLSILCNCCKCCCILLRSINELNMPTSIAASAYIVKLSEEECIGCMACADDRCPTNAIKPRDNIIEIEMEKCIGCGLCATICPNNALTMQNRTIPPHVPTTEKDLMAILRKEKGK